jgi:hypothetical protein
MQAAGQTSRRLFPLLPAPCSQVVTVVPSCWPLHLSQRCKPILPVSSIVRVSDLLHSVYALSGSVCGDDLTLGADRRTVGIGGTGASSGSLPVKLSDSRSSETPAEAVLSISGIHPRGLSGCCMWIPTKTNGFTLWRSVPILVRGANQYFKGANVIVSTKLRAIATIASSEKL